MIPTWFQTNAKREEEEEGKLYTPYKKRPVEQLCCQISDLKNLLLEWSFRWKYLVLYCKDAFSFMLLMKIFLRLGKFCNAWFFRVNTQKIAFWWVTVSNDWEVTSILVGLLLLTHNKKIVTCQLAPSNQKTKAHYQILDIFQINIWETKFPKRLLYSLYSL